MIIRLIPETDAEKARQEEVSIENVKEFFLMGNNVVYDENGEAARYNEIHEWTGSYRYLMGALQYYYEVINDERRDSQTNTRVNPTIMPQLRVIEPETDDPDADFQDGDPEE